MAFLAGGLGGSGLVSTGSALDAFEAALVVGPVTPMSVRCQGRWRSLPPTGALLRERVSASTVSSPIAGVCDLMSRFLVLSAIVAVALDVAWVVSPRQ